MKGKYKLFDEVLKKSDNKEWDKAKKEWEIITITTIDDIYNYGACTCGKTNIKNIIQLLNKINNNELIVGNCCINRFFEIKTANKVFNAIKKNRINNFMIEDSYKKNVLNNWEYNFIKDIYKKKKLSDKQKLHYSKIKDKIILLYKNKQL
jgi:hypothetical protein